MRRILILSSVLVVLALLLIPVTAMVSAEPAQQTTTYVVQWGDTMFSIAVRFNTTVQAIAQANNISNPNLIFAGQTLIIPTGGSVPPTTPPSTPGGTVIYTVQPGDYLAKIARQFNTTVSAILSVNNIPNPNLIYPGQQLVIPTGGTPPPATSMPATVPPPPQATSVPATPPPGGQTTYVVQPGDTLSSIARRFGTTTTAIAQANGIVNPNLIFVGQVLVIPTGGSVPQPTAVPGQPTVPPPNPGSGFELGGQTFNFAHPNEMRQSGMRWAKIQVRYNLGNPPSIAQGAIDTAHSQGFKVLLSVLGDPGQLGANPGAYYSQFASFLGGVAALGPDAIEVWNEQNIDREWPVGQISPSAYTQMLSQAYTAIKIANPNVLVISGAPAPTGFFGGACTGNGCDDKPFIQGMAAAGAANYADCIGVHYNEGIVPPNQTSGDPRGNPNHYTRYFPTMVNTYAQVFPNKLLCFTELGYLSPEGFGAPPPGFEWSANTSVQEQAEWLAQAAVLSRQSGRIRIMVVWNVDSTVWGADPQAGYAIIRPNNSCLACQTLGSVMGTS